ncbi:MAG: hypothetical protein AAB639_00700 [Patescibacteria group bacterium]
MKMDFKRCFTTHALLHNLFGIGLGLVLVALVPTLVTSALVWGVVVIVVAMAADAFLVKA